MCVALCRRADSQVATERASAFEHALAATRGSYDAGETFNGRLIAQLAKPARVADEGLLEQLSAAIRRETNALRSTPSSGENVFRTSDKTSENLTIDDLVALARHFAEVSTILERQLPITMQVRCRHGESSLSACLPRYCDAVCTGSHGGTRRATMPETTQLAFLASPLLMLISREFHVADDAQRVSVHDQCARRHIACGAGGTEAASSRAPG